MANLDWALVCEHAYFDSKNRLCMLGVTRQLAAHGLPDTMTRLVIVAKLTDVRVIEQFDVSVAIVSPSGFLLVADSESESVTIEFSENVVLVTILGMPITEPGNYTFRLQVGDQPPLAIDLPVNDVTRGVPASTH